MTRSQMNSEKLALIEWIIDLTDEEIIQQLKWIKEKEGSDWWDTISESEKQSIGRGIEDLESGKKSPHDQVKKSYEKWI
jgi:hypothetical protein